MGFDPLQSLLEDSGILRDYNSPSGSCLGSVRVHSLTFSYIPSYLALLHPCLGCEPKVKVENELIQIINPKPKTF